MHPWYVRFGNLLWIHIYFEMLVTLQAQLIWVKYTFAPKMYFSLFGFGSLATFGKDWC